MGSVPHQAPHGILDRCGIWAVLLQQVRRRSSLGKPVGNPRDGSARRRLHQRLGNGAAQASNDAVIFCRHHGAAASRSAMTARYQSGLIVGRLTTAMSMPCAARRDAASSALATMSPQAKTTACGEAPRAQDVAATDDHRLFSDGRVSARLMRR